MANLDLKDFSDKEIEALQAALNKRTRSKIDWDNMTHEERAMFNKTVEPKTHQHIWYEYPKTIYGKFPDGTVKSATVQNEAEEAVVRRSNDAEWAESLLAHGVETCPSPPDKAKATGFVTVGVARPIPAPEPVADPIVMIEEHPAAVAARRGRPPGSKNKDQAAA
jgi:hypothetical protein